jgi:hypothetical protein
MANKLKFQYLIYIFVDIQDCKGSCIHMSNLMILHNKY